MLIHILISIYFCINCFLAGGYYADNRNRLLTFVWLLFGSIILLGDAILQLLSAMYFFTNNTFQLMFFFTYLFTKKYDKLENKQLVMLSDSLKHFNSNSFQHKIYRYCVNLVFQINNYNP